MNTIESTIRNQAELDQFEQAWRSLNPAGKSDPAIFEAYEQARMVLHESVVAAVQTIDLDETIGTPDSVMTCVLVQYEHGAEYRDGRVVGTVDFVVLTQDGGQAYYQTWHEGPSRDTVYYERYSAAGRIGHGYVDSETRRLVQAG